jgi:CheY-like chemotaxis protein
MVHNILLIDDSDVDNFISKRLLTQRDISEDITTVYSAQDALNYLDELQKNFQPFPEIILLDLNMPGMDGFEFMELFSSYPFDIIKSVRIFILSSSSNPKDIHKTKRIRYVKDYFIKPFTPDMANKIAEYLSAMMKNTNDSNHSKPAS